MATAAFGNSLFGSTTNALAEDPPCALFIYPTQFEEAFAVTIATVANGYSKYAQLGSAEITLRTARRAGLSAACVSAIGTAVA
jgi:hypothetical protein